MKFVKMQGLGNDYIYFYSDEERNWNELSANLSDRHFGIGSDGIIVISSSKVADFKMRIFNADGSEAKMCGNGIRCVGKYVYDHHLTKKTALSIETLSGIKHLKLVVKDCYVTDVSVQMGKSVVEDKKIFNFLNNKISYYPVNVGNSHAVILCDDAESDLLEEIGKAFQYSPDYQDGINVELVSKIDGGKLRMRVCERGSGITLACGTGACAAVSAATYEGLIPYGKEIEIVLDKGSLFISVDREGFVTMKGNAVTVFEGEVDI